MASYWHLQAPYDGELIAKVVPDLATALNLEGERVSGGDDSACRVDLHELGGQRYYFKRYRAANSSLRNVLMRSKVRTEWDNLQLFRRLGLATPTPVAVGEQRKLGVFREGVLVTAEVPAATDLAQLAENRSELFADRAWYGALCQALATSLRRLHDIGFAHNDLNWRNVLLRLEPELAVYFFDCPTGRRWYWPFRQFRIAKDLTHLDKMGRRYLSRSQRMRFYLAYRGHRRLNAGDKRLLRRVLRRDVDTKYMLGRGSAAPAGKT